MMVFTYHKHAPNVLQDNIHTSTSFTTTINQYYDNNDYTGIKRIVLISDNLSGNIVVRGSEKREHNDHNGRGVANDRRSSTYPQTHRVHCQAEDQQWGVRSFQTWWAWEVARQTRCAQTLYRETARRQKIKAEIDSPLFKRFVAHLLLIVIPTSSDRFSSRYPFSITDKKSHLQPVIWIGRLEVDNSMQQYVYAASVEVAK
jgi:hypothetical protein